MKICFDTSTLVAALLQQHPHHALVFPRLQAVKAGTLQGHLTTHGLVELFATLTALPIKPRLLPADVDRIIQESNLSCFTVIPLRDYCKSKGAMFQAVDLRWGISEDAGLDQQTMNICLREGFGNRLAILGLGRGVPSPNTAWRVGPVECRIHRQQVRHWSGSPSPSSMQRDSGRCRSTGCRNTGEVNGSDRARWKGPSITPCH